MTRERNLNEINLILEVLKELRCLTGTTPELQEGERQEIIQGFRIRMINFVLEKLRWMNQEHEPYKDKF